MHIGNTYLITADNWFFAPDGEQYRAVFGTVLAVLDSEAVLGIKPNRNATNWYVAIGDMIVAGCQIHYAMRADTYNAAPSHMVEIDHNGTRHIVSAAVTRIYNADASGLTALTNPIQSGQAGRPLSVRT